MLLFARCALGDNQHTSLSEQPYLRQNRTSDLPYQSRDRVVLRNGCEAVAPQWVSTGGKTGDADAGHGEPGYSERFHPHYDQRQPRLLLLATAPTRLQIASCQRSSKLHVEREREELKFGGSAGNAKTRQ